MPTLKERWDEFRLDIVYGWRGFWLRIGRWWDRFRDLLAWQPQESNSCIQCLDWSAIPGLEEVGKAASISSQGQDTHFRNFVTGESHLHLE